jgi:hypothetical protein
MDHGFTPKIIEILEKHFGKKAKSIFKQSEIIQYLNIKTRSANRGSKARGGFANHYAIYVLVEDYVDNGFVEKQGYKNFEGAVFSKLFQRQRLLPFGSKLQNHALNHRLNEEFKKYFPTCEFIPILRNPETNRYWINENLVKINIDGKVLNLARAILEVIDEYVKAKRDAFDAFIDSCIKIQELVSHDDAESSQFILQLLEPNVDARLFEIVSYSILKYFYKDTKVYFGFDLKNIKEEELKLFKTGRTNANDGGIDFVMKPLGRFFQVTETIDFRKYFLDIEKIERFPISFVIKTNDPVTVVLKLIRENAQKQYSVNPIVEKYMSCIEEVINIPILRDRFQIARKANHQKEIFEEIVRQSKVEFNYEDLTGDAEEDDGISEKPPGYSVS